MTVMTLPARGETRDHVAIGTTPTPTPDIVYVPAPDGAPADAPRVFAAINAVMRDAMPVGKNQRNESQNYAFRGIDDVMSAMAGPLRAHGVFILPRLASQAQVRDGKMTRTLITMHYRVYGPAGDCLIAEVPGEASDFADKSMNKAQSAALKYLLFTLFMLPVDGRSIDDGDRHHPEPTPEQRAERAEYTQRQQQRGQRQPQRGQQQRRGKAAEQRPAPEEPTAGPRRDYLAEAMKATSREQFNRVRADAVTDGAPEDYLARIDAVARQRERAVTNNPHRNRPARQDDASGREAGGASHAEPVQGSHVPPDDADDRKAIGLATADMLAAGAGVGVTAAEVRAMFQRQHGHDVDAATVAELRAIEADLKAAGGAQ